MPDRQRPRPRRSVRDRAGADAEETDARAAQADRRARESPAEGEVRAAPAPPATNRRTSATCSIASRTCSAKLKDYPAIDVRTDAPDLLLAIVDDFGPTALEDLERDGSVRIFFPSPA